MSAAHGGYYLPEPSKWPIIVSIGLFTLALGFIMFINDVTVGPWLMLTGAAVIIAVVFGWFGEVVRESEDGRYDEQVDRSFRLGMVWFIFTEVMFFAVFFGALFYARTWAVEWLADTESLWPGYEGGWPTAGPAGQTMIAPDTPPADMTRQFSPMGAWGIPAINTLILLTSGLTVTIAHWGVKQGNRAKLNLWLFLTVVLGISFLSLQVYEYAHAYSTLGLTLGTGIYGATFFMLTGFHGFHVTLGTIMLTVILVRCLRGHFTPERHFAFEGVAWYWHFVDVVWLFLFVFVYWL